MCKLYIGIDVGSKGFVSTQKKGVWEHFSIEDNDLYQLSDYMTKLRDENEDIACVIEEVHALFGSSAKATFAFGEIFGKLQALLLANKIPYHLVAPKKWQSIMWENKDIVYKYTGKKLKDGSPQKKIDTKPTSINACKRLFPNIDQRKNPEGRGKKPDDNKVDSILMCEYARRMNL